MNKCECPECPERDSVAAVLDGEIEYQKRKRPSSEVAYAIVILTQVLDGIGGRSRP